jgi:hypothetical protein
MITNKTRKTILHRKFKICDNPASKSLGLMFRTKRYIQENALIFTSKKPHFQGFHMFFVFYPIDMIFLDGDKKVVDMKKKFMPFTIYNSKADAQYVIEADCGTIDASRTETGDMISWENSDDKNDFGKN